MKIEELESEFILELVKANVIPVMDHNIIYLADSKYNRQISSAIIQKLGLDMNDELYRFIEGFICIHFSKKGVRIAV